MGQNDPVEYMKKYADRIKVLHIKDRAVLGQSGMMNFEMIFKQMYANGIQDYFVEDIEYSKMLSCLSEAILRIS